MIWLSAAGIAIGFGLMLAAGRLLQQRLYGVRPADPLTIAGVAVLLGPWRSPRRGSRRSGPPAWIPSRL